MKYIKKTLEPDFFNKDTKELKEKIKLLPEKKKSKVWDDEYKEKRKLKEYILSNEQNSLCCYCEAEVTLDNSHVEHIKPKSLDYDNLTFDYSNLAVSCEGICFSENNKPLTCGHKKGNDFDENLFLNPIIQIDIRDYFTYSDNGYIGCSGKDKDRAKYTMELLQLNTFNNYLPEARIISLEQFRKRVEEYSKKTNRDKKDIAKILLNKENIAFISFLKFKYRKVLE